MTLTKNKLKDSKVKKMKLDVRKPSLIGSEDSCSTLDRVPLSQTELSIIVQPANGKLAENQSESSRLCKSSVNGHLKGLPQTVNMKVEVLESVSSSPDKENTTSNMLNMEGKNGETYTCPLCDQILTSPHTFTVHIRQHNPSDHSHTCRLCGKTLSSASSLDRHMLVHSGERPFKCRLCNMAFTTNGNMHRHMRTHGEENQSTDGSKPGKESKSKKRKPDPNANSNGTSNKKLGIELNEEIEKLHCPVCDKTFFGPITLQAHMELHPNDPIWCKQCSQALPNYSIYMEHPCIKFPNEVENKGNTTSIGFQDLTFMDFSTNKFSLVAKSICETNSRRPSSAFHAFECNKCEKSFPCNSALRLHGMMHSDKKSTFCPSCQCDFLTSASLKAHQLTHRKAEHCHAPESLHIEDTAPEEETQKEDFMALLELKNKEDQNNRKKEKMREPLFENMSYFVHGKPEFESPPPALTEPSGKAGETDHSDFADIQSIISVTSKSPLVPNIGASPVVAASSSPGHPALGSSSCLSPDSPPPADSANASPETPSKEDSEQSSQKGSEDPESEDGGQVEEPMETVHSSCKTCNLSFKSPHALKKHNRKHSQGLSSSTSSFSCNMCPYTSLDKSTLIRHLRTHNGERPFQCAICKYAFTTKANCERHVRKRHKKLSKQEIRCAMQYNPNMADVKATEVLPPEISASETVCKYCTVDFKFNRVLRHHLRSLHNSCSRKPFFCILCKLGFSTKNNCIRHVLKQHPDMKDKLHDIVSANGQSDFSDQESLQLSDESPQKEVPSDLDQPLNLSVKMISFSSNNSVLGNDDHSVDDLVTAANCLVSLSEIPPPQDEPLDLVIHAIDLCTKVKPLPSPSNRILSPPEVKPIICLPLKRPVPPPHPPPRMMSPVQPLELTFLSQSPAPALSPAVHIAPQTPVITAVEDLSMLSKNVIKEDVYKMTFKIVNDQLSPRNQRSFSCVYCSAGFTLKSNMERHIKRKHPEFARPTRSRNFIPTLTSPIPKSSTPTLSVKTRDALRVVLSNKAVSSGAPIKDDYQSSNDVSEEKPDLDLSDSESLIINESEDIPENSSQASSVLESDQCTQPPTKEQQSGDSETAPDLASVSSVIDTANTQQFQQYLLDAQNNDEKKETISESKEKSSSDGSSEKNEGSSGSSSATTKKRSSYTDSPNSVACPFCTRKFPWSSSLRRHILTHTGQKPYKCPRCPIWFTTKSNCERHLVRKHGQNSEILTRTVPERPYKCNICPSSTFSTQGNLRKHYYLKHWKKTGGRSKSLFNLDRASLDSLDPAELLQGDDDEDDLGKNGDSEEEALEEDSDPGSLVIASEGLEPAPGDNDLPYKCHLCEESFLKRHNCIDHLKSEHKEEYRLLESKGAMETPLVDNPVPFEDDPTDPKDPTGQQRKVICALCNRRFWSAEDLRRHMRTHSGERPFSCDICQRRFSLKHSMIRHRRKHHGSSNTLANESSDEECTSTPTPAQKTSTPAAKNNGPKLKKNSQNSLLYLMAQTDRRLAPAWGKGSSKSSSSSTTATGVSSESKREDDNTDLIQNLLGIHDSKIIDEMLDSADSAARLLGVKEI